MNVTQSYDILIVGGGIIGPALANMLADTNLSIAVLEKQSAPCPWSHAAYHPRVSAITLLSQRIFKALKLWEILCNKRVSPFTAIQVWDKESGGEIHFKAQDIAEPVLGHIIENNLIQSVLHEKLTACSHIQMFYDIELVHFSANANGVEFVTKTGKIFKAKIAVAADGAHSWVRQQAGIRIMKNDYRQTALVATVQTALPHQNIARQVFLKEGPLAFLPLTHPHTSSIVWTLPTQTARESMVLTEEDFKQQLAQAFAYLGKVVQIEDRGAFPLFKQQAQDYIQSNVILVGDAAHVLHPLAGQGINLGLLDAASLYDVITDTLLNHRALSAANLRHYERWRKADNFALLQGIDLIKILFAMQTGPLPTLRALGLKFTDRDAWIKNIFTRHAVGNRTDLPTLACPHFAQGKGCTTNF